MTYAERIAELTLDEKIDLLGGSDLWHTARVPRLGIPAVRLSDGPHGLRIQFPEASGREGSEPATCFPPAVAIAATWSREVAGAVGSALGREARAAGVNLILGPGLNLKRTPLCGRNFEYYSEDPLLAGELAGHLVEGIQSEGVGATLKHFAANNQETERMSISVEVDERTLRELYLAGFERAIRHCEPWAVMCSYNRINGTYASEDPWLLTRVLRDDWGYTGLVVSDWGAVSRRDRGVAAGLDLEMPSSSGHGARVVREALAAGTLTEPEVDACARRVLQLVDRAVGEPTLEVDADAQHQAAYAAALEAPVLLKNDGILPLDPAGGAVAVIGELARTPRFQGAGSSKVAATRIDAPLDWLGTRLAGGRALLFSAGYRLDGQPDADLLATALEVARQAEVVLVFLGSPEQAESESFDRTSLELPRVQQELLAALTEVNPDIAVILQNGAVLLTAGWEHHARAILEGWLLGQAGGRVLADLLVGAATPSGKLAETIPVSAAQLPTVGNYPGEFGQVHYGERLLVGYRWYDAHDLPVSYPFGHGLSYTSFEFADPVVHLDPATALGSIDVTVTNTGRRDGAEVVQLYVAQLAPTVARPPQELKGFAKVSLVPGESRRISLSLEQRSFATWHLPLGRWVAEPGDYELRLGTSSRQIHHVLTVSLDGDDVRPPLSLDSPISAWLDHPVIGPQVLAEITGRYRGLLTDPNEARLYRPIPLSRITRFPGFTLTEQRAMALLATLELAG